MIPNGDFGCVSTDRGPHSQGACRAFEGPLLALGIRPLANAITPGSAKGTLQGCRQDVAQTSWDVQNKVLLGS